MKTVLLRKLERFGKKTTFNEVTGVTGNRYATMLHLLARQDELRALLKCVGKISGGATPNFDYTINASYKKPMRSLETLTLTFGVVTQQQQIALANLMHTAFRLLPCVSSSLHIDAMIDNGRLTYVFNTKK